MDSKIGLARNHVTRRTFLGAVGAVIATAGAALAQQPAPAQQAPRVKGPRVWLDMDQKELDDAYDQSVYASNREQIIRRYTTNSEATRAHLGPPRRYAYGPTPVEGLERLHDQASQRTDQHLHSWRRVARRPRQRLRVPSRAIRARGRALRSARLYYREGRRRQPDADGRTGASRGCLGVSQRPDFWRRPKPPLHIRALLRRPPGGRRVGDRLAKGVQPAFRHSEGRSMLAVVCST